IKTTGATFRRRFVCTEEVFKKLVVKRLNGKEKGHKDLRTSYDTLMRVTLSKKLGVFQDVHTHPLITSSKLIKHRSHSRYHCTNICKSSVSDLINEGLKPSQITRVVNVMKPSKEANAMLDDNYCSSMDLSRDGSLGSAFWANGRSRASYT
ncbi:hypothetical protein RJ639_022875, partial [Escallonia herrerae]